MTWRKGRDAITNLITRHSYRTFFAFATFIVIVCAVVWWPSPEDSPPRTLEDVKDACASAVQPDSYDVQRRTSFEDDGEMGEVSYDQRVSGHAKHTITTINGVLIQEAIFIFSDGTGRPAKEYDAATVTTYIRWYGDALTRFDDDAYASDGVDDEWGSWGVTVHTGRGQRREELEAAMAAAQAAGEYDDLICGVHTGPSDHPDYETVFRHEGEETINGVSTDHLSRSSSRIGSGAYQSMEYWIDPNGLTTQWRSVQYEPPTDSYSGHRTETVETFSGWGEPNVITAPITNLIPMALPDLTPQPTPTIRPTPVPQVENGGDWMYGEVECPEGFYDQCSVAKSQHTHFITLEAYEDTNTGIYGDASIRVSCYDGEPNFTFDSGGPWIGLGEIDFSIRFGDQAPESGTYWTDNIKNIGIEWVWFGPHSTRAILVYIEEAERQGKDLTVEASDGNSEETIVADFDVTGFTMSYQRLPCS